MSLTVIQPRWTAVRCADQLWFPHRRLLIWGDDVLGEEWWAHWHEAFITPRCAQPGAIPGPQSEGYDYPDSQVFLPSVSGQDPYGYSRTGVDGSWGWNQPEWGGRWLDLFVFGPGGGGGSGSKQASGSLCSGGAGGGSGGSGFVRASVASPWESRL